MKIVYTCMLAMLLITFSGVVNAAALTTEKPSYAYPGIQTRQATADTEIKNAYAILGQLTSEQVIDGNSDDTSGLPTDLADLIFEYAGDIGPKQIASRSGEQAPLAVGTNAASWVFALSHGHNALQCTTICTGKTHTLLHDEGSIQAAALGSDKNGEMITALYSREQNCLYLKELASGKLKKRWDTSIDRMINKVMIRNNQDGTPYVVTVSDTKVCLWDMRVDQFYREFKGENCNAFDLALDSDGSLCMVVGNFVWDLESGMPRRILEQSTSSACLFAPRSPTIQAVALGKDSQKNLCAALATKNSIHIYTVATGELVHTLSCNGTVSSLALDYTKEGTLIVVAGLQENLRSENLIVWLIDPNGTIKRYARTHGQSVTHVMISKNTAGKFFITSTAQEAATEIGDAPTYSTRVHEIDIIPGDFEMEFKKRLAHEQSAASCVIL